MTARTTRAPAVAGTDPCGPGAQCVGLGGSLTACFKNYASAVDCPTGYARILPSATTPRLCAPVCDADVDCTADRRCLIAAGEIVGRCVVR